MAVVVTEAKTRAREEFGKAMENDFWMALKRFWTTIRHIKKGKQCTFNTVYSGDGVLLTTTKDVVDWWKEYFKDLPNPMDTPSGDEAVSREPGDGLSYLVVKILLSSRAPEVDEIRLEFFKGCRV